MKTNYKKANTAIMLLVLFTLCDNLVATDPITTDAPVTQPIHANITQVYSDVAPIPAGKEDLEEIDEIESHEAGQTESEQPEQISDFEPATAMSLRETLQVIDNAAPDSKKNFLNS